MRKLISITKKGKTTTIPLIIVGHFAANRLFLHQLLKASRPTTLTQYPTRSIVLVHILLTLWSVPHVKSTKWENQKLVSISD